MAAQKKSPYVVPGLKKFNTRPLDYAQRVLKEYADMVRLIDFVVSITSEHFSITEDELKYSKKYVHTKPRHVVIWIVRRIKEYSWAWIAEYFKYKDRGASYEAFQSVDKRIRDKEPEKDDVQTIFPIAKKWAENNLKKQ